MEARLFVIGALVVLAVSGAVAQQPQPSSAGTDAAYQRVLDRARQSEQAGDLADALSQVETMLRVGGDSVPPRLRSEAVERIVSLQAATTASGPMQRAAGRLASVLTATTFWMIVLLVMLAARLRYAHLHPRTDATAAFFEDLASPLDRRTEASLVLTRTLLNHLQNPLPVAVTTLEMDMMPGSEEPGFLALQSTLNTSPIDGFTLADRPLKVGGFEFSVRDIAGAASGVFSRPYAANLTGWLSESEHGLVAYAELFDRLDPAKNRAWRIQTRKGGRAEAINDLSAQILVDTDKSKLTHSWKSLRTFRNAIGLRQSAGRRGPADLLQARNCLEEAVTYDASNWIARFNLALTLCRCGEPEIALQHFDVLDTVIRLAWQSNQDPTTACSNTPAFQDVKDHLRHYPECAFLILYNEALALAALHTPEATTKALETLRRLATPHDETKKGAYDDDPHRSLAQALEPRARTELRLYAMGAEANVLATSAHLRRGRNEFETETADRIEALLTAVQHLCTATQEQHWRSLQTARAVTLAAAARVSASKGRTDVARTRLEAAIAAEPGFVEAYLSLAELHIDAATACDKDWHRAEMLLKRVLELSPDCSRAMSLLTRLPARSPVPTSAASAGR